MSANKDGMQLHIHADAIKDHLLPAELTPEQISYKYADEADMLNVALFGKTAKTGKYGKLQRNPYRTRENNVRKTGASERTCT